MTFAVTLSTNAQLDFHRAQAYYDAEASEQTGRFIEEFFATTRRLTGFPHSAPVVHGGARRVSLHIFPYQLWHGTTLCLGHSPDSPHREATMRR